MSVESADENFQRKRNEMKTMVYSKSRKPRKPWVFLLSKRLCFPALIFWHFVFNDPTVVRSALALLDEMTREKVDPSVDCFLHVANAARNGKAAEATLGILGAARFAIVKGIVVGEDEAAYDLAPLYKVCLGACREAAQRAKTRNVDFADVEAAWLPWRRRTFDDAPPWVSRPQQQEEDNLRQEYNFSTT